MTDNETLAIDTATDADTQVENQATAAKTYTEAEVNNMMARMRGSLEKKLLKPYADLGDPEELRKLKTDAELRQQEQQVKRGEFEKILQEKADKWNSEIQKRDSIIRDYRVHTPIVSAAAKFRAVNADQVKALVAPMVRLNADGEVEVTDSKGTVRYTDSGELLAVEDLVREFLEANPHFVASGPATTHTRSNIVSNSGGDVDITKLDMKNPEHRKLYAQYRKAKGLA
jgi:hypothetical protein